MSLGGQPTGKDAGQMNSVTRSSAEASDVLDKTDARVESSDQPSADPEVRMVQFQELALPLKDMLYGASLRMCGDAAKAEDLVQETHIRAWKNFDRFQLGTNFKAWIFRILSFLHKNERRSAKNRELPVDFTEHEAMASRTPDSAHGRKTDWDAVYPDLVEDHLKRALDRLDYDQRTVLMMVSLGDLSYQETAEALEIPIGTVMSRLYRARKQLQQELQTFAADRGWA
jgi:RNA polymerase sigma-70 factor (ECF subfamily)